MKGYPRDEIDEADREELRKGRYANIIAEEEEVDNDPRLRRLRDIRDLNALPDPDDPEEMETRHRGLRYVQQERKARIRERLLAARHGYMLPHEVETKEEQRLINERLEKLRSGQKKPKGNRPLDRQFIRPNLKCQICEKVDTTLFHCAECKDSAYCSQPCQMEGCGYKHL
jgi:hypothetical protein